MIQPFMLLSAVLAVGSGVSAEPKPSTQREKEIAAKGTSWWQSDDDDSKSDQDRAKKSDIPDLEDEDDAPLEEDEEDEIRN